MICSTNYPNVHILTFWKRWSFIWGCFFPWVSLKLLLQPLETISIWMCCVLWKQFCHSCMYTKTVRNRSQLFKETTWVVKHSCCWSSCKCNDMQIWFSVLFGIYLHAFNTFPRQVSFGKTSVPMKKANGSDIILLVLYYRFLSVLVPYSHYFINSCLFLVIAISIATFTIQSPIQKRVKRLKKLVVLSFLWIWWQNIFSLHLFLYNRIDVSQGIDVSKINNSCKCIICSYYYLK